MTILWGGLSQLYSLSMKTRALLFQSQLLKTVRVACPVISVGNLSMGGTGKTPVVMALLRECQKRNIKTCLVARNYKAQSVGIEKVQRHRLDGASFYGDEAFLVAQNFPEVSVWTGPVKSKVAQCAVAHEKFDLLIVDDGFQHLALHRDLNIVLIDASAAESENKVVPQGRLREGWEALSRADLIFLTKIQGVSENQKNKLKEHFPAGIAVEEICFSQALGQPLLPTERVVTVAGLAQNEAFHQGVRQLTTVAATLSFADHHPYDQKDVQTILKTLKKNDCAHVVTSQKDAVKLSRFPEIKDLIIEVEWLVQWNQLPRRLDEFLAQIAL